MKKSNWIILGLLAVASVFFIWLWYYLQFNLVDNPFDLVLTVVWWAVILAAVMAIHFAEKKREERIRTAFLGAGCLFNPEAGLVRVETGDSMVTALQDVLANLKNSFHLAEFPEKGRPQFAYVVHTSKFDQDNDVWEGEVSMVARPNDDPRPFANRDELVALVEA